MQRIGRILITVGVAVWAVYGIVWAAFGKPSVAQFLPFHLAGVVPGAVLTRWEGIRARFAGGE